MGSWSLERLTTFSAPLDGAIFGTNYHAVFHLKYKSSMGSFEETPRLDWHETIMMNEHHNNQAWVFDTNMYEHNPTSVTLIVWARRYVECYRKAANMGPGVRKGKAELKKLNGTPVTMQELGANIQTAAGQADAVRTYLKRNGGLMIIEIHDVPGINAPTGVQHKERLLWFNVGVTGLPLRSMGEQYLNVQGQVAGAWQRNFDDNGWHRGKLVTTGLQVVPPPGLVANPRAPMFTAGECW